MLISWSTFNDLTKYSYYLLMFVLSEKKTEFHNVKFLPPIELNFQYPKDYPSVSSPEFTLSCKWLNRKQVGIICEVFHFRVVWQLEGVFC